MSGAALLWAAFFDLPAAFLLLLRIVAGIGGGFVGWFLTGPVVRLLHRAAFRKPVAKWLLPWSKLAGALALGLLVYYFIPLGGGAGWGWGPGHGGGPGLGPGTEGGDKVPAQDKPDPKAKKPRDPFDIEIIDVDRYQGDEKYYLLQRKPPAKPLAEVEEFLKENKDRLEVHIIQTRTSVSEAEGLIPLRNLTQKFEIPTVIPKMVETPK